MTSAHENPREPNLYHCDSATSTYTRYGGYRQIRRGGKTLTRLGKAKVHPPMLPIKIFNRKKPKESKDEVPTYQVLKNHGL